MESRWSGVRKTRGDRCASPFSDFECQLQSRHRTRHFEGEVYAASGKVANLFNCLWSSLQRFGCSKTRRSLQLARIGIDGDDFRSTGQFRGQEGAAPLDRPASGLSRRRRIPELRQQLRGPKPSASASAGLR